MASPPDSGRRRLLSAMAGASVLGLAGITRPIRAGKSKGKRVIVAGGGFAGASCALALRRLAPDVAVTLIDRQARFVSGPFCNTVSAGLRPMSAITRDHTGLAAEGAAVPNRLECPLRQSYPLARSATPAVSQHWLRTARSARPNPNTRDRGTRISCATVSAGRAAPGNNHCMPACNRRAARRHQHGVT